MLITQNHTIENALSDVKNQLSRAAADKHHKFRFFSISTVDNETLSISCRMVVLRDFDSEWTVKFYTDYRTSKVRDLLQNRRATALFWDPSKNLQVRMKCDAVINHQNSVTRGTWKGVKGEAQKSYSALLKPGSPVTSPDIAFQWPDKIDGEHFTVVDCIPTALQILQLNRNEHLALKFIRDGRGDEWKGGWIVP
jgi:pyridoxamine 5'-phosphate oxidase